MKDIGITSYKEVYDWGLEKIHFNYTDVTSKSLSYEEIEKDLEGLEEDNVIILGSEEISKDEKTDVTED